MVTERLENVTDATRARCLKNNILVCVVSNFCREVDEIWALLGCYAAIVVITYRRFGTTCSSHLQGSRKNADISILLVHMHMRLAVNGVWKDFLGRKKDTQITEPIAVRRIEIRSHKIGERIFFLVLFY